MLIQMMMAVMSAVECLGCGSVAVVTRGVDARQPDSRRNLAGRPRSLRRLVRDALGDEGETLVRFLVGVFRDGTASMADRTAAAAGLTAVLGRYARGIPGAEAAAPQRGGTLRVGWIPNAHTLDPHYSVDFAERHVMYAVYNTMVAVSPTFEIRPELARSWKIAPDGKTITFELVPNVKFHDGTACDAAAITERDGGRAGAAAS